jgi:O-antigen ligase
MRKITSLLAGCLLIAIPFIEDYPDGLWGRDRVIFYTFISCLILLCGILSLSLLKVNGQKTRITTIDIAVGGYFLYGLMHVTFIQRLPFDPLTGYKWATVLSGYALFRALPDRYIAWYSLVLSGVVQSLMVIVSVMGDHPSPHATASFNNPGVFGGYMALTLIPAVSLCIDATRRKRVIWAIVCAILLFIIIVGLYLSDSRAAFMGIFVGLVGLSLQLLKRHRAIFVLVLAVVGIGILLLLYNHRPASANARVLAWQVSSEMIADAPLFGHGVGSFAREYMLYQASHFEKYIDSPFSIVAGNVIYPYNEFLHAWIEQGFLGLLWVLSIFFLALRDSSPDTLNHTLKNSLLVWITFSIFSYPVSIFSLLFLLAFFTGMLRGRVVYKFHSRLRIFPVYAIIFVSLLTLAIKGLRTTQNVSTEMNALYTSVRQHPPTPCIQSHYGYLKHNIEFRVAYFPILRETISRVEDIAKIEEIILPTPETYCDLGKIYERYGLFNEAKRVYQKASFMIPTRFTPNYHLWELYLRLGDEASALTMARKLLSMPLKVETTFTMRAKGVIQKYMEGKDYH